MRNVESLVEVDDRSKKGERRLPVLNRRIASCPKWHGHLAHVWRFLRTTGETPVPLLGCALPSGTEHTMTRTADEVVVQNRIHLICGQKVMLDSELAGLYGVETKTLNRAVRRHIARFPDDFLLHLTRR